jgi:hypothetical protein
MKRLFRDINWIEAKGKNRSICGQLRFINDESRLGSDKCLQK